MVLQKSETVAELTDSIKKSVGIYLADFTGVKVEAVTALRANLREKGIGMRVAKNTLIRRAFHENGIKFLDPYLVGPTALIFSDDQDPILPAKMLVDFHKTNDGRMSVKSVSFDGQKYDGKQIEDLAKMPGKRELQAQVVSIALGAGARVIGLIQGPGSMVAGQIKALVEKLEG